MNIRSIVRTAAIATLVVAGSVAAQAVTSTTLGTVVLSGNAQGTTALSVPITITANGSGSLANLSNCRLVNASGVAVSSTLATVPAGANTFVFLNGGLFAGGSQGAVTLSLRCDLATSTPAGTTFSSVAGNPTYVGSATAPLSVNLDTAPTVPAGSTNVALANISLGANSASSITISSIPVSVSAGSGAALGNLINCRIRNTTDVNSNLSAAQTLSSGGTTSFQLSTPLTVFAGTSPMLAFACDVQPSTMVGSAYTISINPASVSAVNSSTGAAVTPTAVVGVGPNGLPASQSGTVIVTSDAGTGTGTGTGTPGIPDTGMGQATSTLAILALAALVALVSGFYLRRSIR